MICAHITGHDITFRYEDGTPMFRPCLGTVGSYGVEKIQFSFSEDWAAFGTRIVSVWPDGYEAGIPVLLDETNVLTVSEGMTQAAGVLTVTGTDTAARQITASAPYTVVKTKGMSTGAEPEPEPGLVEQIVQRTAEDRAAAEKAAEKAENASYHAPYLSENQTWMVWNTETEQFEDSGVYSGGEAPIIGSNGNWFIGAEDSGVAATGPKGDKGDAFVYEDFTEEQLAALHGNDGYTPVRGTDYYTAADKTEMVNAVIAALPTWTGGSY